MTITDYHDLCIDRGFNDQSNSDDQYFSGSSSADATILNEHTYATPGNAVSVKVVCINMCGLLSKLLRYPDFEEFCQSYDIVCLVETELNSLDSFDIPNFKILYLLNHKNATSRSGGVAVLVKDVIFEYVKLEGKF